MLLGCEKDNLYGKEGEHGGYLEVFKEMGLSQDDDRCVCSLSQHPVKHPTVAHKDGSLPTFLSSSSARLWSFKHKRWLSGAEKFASMMWPVTEDLAKCVGRPIVDVRGCNSHERIGNAMHLGNLVLVLLSVLTSIERVDAEPVPQELQKTKQELKQLELALERVAKLPFVAEASGETAGCFNEVLGELGLEADLKPEEGSTVLTLAKLGASQQRASHKVDELSRQITRNQSRLQGMKKTLDGKKNKAKLKALEGLDADKVEQAKSKTNKRRRLNWNVKKAKQDAKKRIKETFTDMTPVRTYQKQSTLEEKLQVVQWYNKQLKGEKPEVVSEQGAEEVPGPEEDKKKGGKKKGLRKRASKRKKGRNLAAMARKEFPNIVGPNTSLSRWAAACKAQRWEDIPQRVREQNKEVPDSWKHAFGLKDGIKGRQRFKQVPGEVLRRLDEHMVLVCQGLSKVTERNEEDASQIGEIGKSSKESLGVSLHDHIAQSRRSITVMTSSWGDCSPGPLGLCIPEGMVSADDIRKFNDAHRGEAWAVASQSKSHFMTGTLWTQMLYELYTPAYDRQRSKYQLTLGTKGKFLADAWTGFRSADAGESVERSAWEELNQVDMPTAVQRAVAKFTRSRSQILSGEKEVSKLSDKQKTQLQALFDGRIYHVFLPRTQCVAPPSWMAKHVRTTDAGEKEVTCKRGRPQLFSLKFTADLTENGQMDYFQGGKFSLTGPNIAESPIRCVALRLAGEDGEDSAPQWRLENYDGEDEDSEAGEAEEDDMSESSEEDQMQAPRGHELGYRSGSDMEAFDDWEDLQEDEGVEIWRGGPDDKQPLQVGTAEEPTGTSSPILRPRAKHESAEWQLLEDEGWFQQLPQIQGTTLSRHNHIGAWSSRYPTPAGMRHCARHFGETKSALVALLECMAWMVSQHFTHGGKDDDYAVLHQRLLARIAIEDCICEFASFRVCLSRLMRDILLHTSI
eukprot:Skav223380  [mRNA]  locus=scaffold2634:201140:209818:- [translate_table: standard]